MPLRNQFDTEKEWLDHLRMYFAAKALQGLIGRSWSDENGNVPDDIFARWSSAAWATADAMLAARGAA